MAEEAGIELVTETHVERYNHDPRRMMAAHEALQRAHRWPAGHPSLRGPVPLRPPDRQQPLPPVALDLDRRTAPRSVRPG